VSYSTFTFSAAVSSITINSSSVAATTVSSPTINGNLSAGTVNNYGTITNNLLPSTNTWSGTNSFLASLNVSGSVVNNSSTTFNGAQITNAPRYSTGLQSQVVTASPTTTSYSNTTLGCVSVSTITINISVPTTLLIYYEGGLTPDTGTNCFLEGTILIDGVNVAGNGKYLTVGGCFTGGSWATLSGVTWVASLTAGSHSLCFATISQGSTYGAQNSGILTFGYVGL